MAGGYAVWGRKGKFRGRAEGEEGKEVEGEKERREREEGKEGKKGEGRRKEG